MKTVSALTAAPRGRAIIAVLACGLAAACTSGATSVLELDSPALTTAVPAETDVDAADLASVETETPEKVAITPATTGAKTQEVTAATADAVPAETATANAPEAKPAAPDAAAPAVAVAEPAKVEAVAEVKPTAFVENGPGPTPVETAKKKGFFANLFANQPAQASSGETGAPQDAAPAAVPTVKLASAASIVAPSAASAPAAVVEKPKPIVDLAPAAPAKPIISASYTEEALPGVRRQMALFEIRRKSGMDDDSDIDLHEEEGVQLAFAPGLARLAPNGLLKQHDKVDVACLKPSLVRILKTMEQYYGKKLVVTSGYRSPTYNRQVRGARNSQHMYCAAADIHMPGISKWELAKFAKSLPGRGGVGTYCHTDAIHVDVGPEREWNWRCKRKA